MPTPQPVPGEVPAMKKVSITGPHAQQRNLSRERIAEDMAAFSNAGGHIEVLGNTPFRTRVDPPKPATASGKAARPLAADAEAAAVPPAPPRKRTPSR